MNHNSFIITLDHFVDKVNGNLVEYNQGTVILIWLIINFSNGQVSEKLEHQMEGLR